MDTKQANKVEIVNETKLVLNDNEIAISASNPKLTKEIILAALESAKFQHWLKNIDLSQHKLESIQFRDVFFFGRGSVGFICFNTIIYPISKTSEKLAAIPGYVFLRGNAVGILVVIDEKETNKKYLMLTEQYRVPLGRRTTECPAGMMDDSKHFKGQAAIELEEEAGIKIDPESLKELIEITPSGGACDEKITCFYTEIVKTEIEMREIESKLYGMHDHGEFINIRIVEFDVQKILKEKLAQDAIFISCIFAYQNLIMKSLETQPKSLAMPSL
jgi:ADP-sugar diphosphatase